ncbi:hypothetical protein PT276_06910 [Orbaceae bacterium ESL0721]|nr:hypothetical protein [Orbaceae bacterium ESL0721]
MIEKIYYILFLMLKTIIIGVLCVSLALISEIIVILWLKGILFKISFNDFIIAIYLSMKNILVGGIFAGLGGWMMSMYYYNRTAKLGKKTLIIFRKNGYDAEINEISPDPKVPFYKIDGELFYLADIASVNQTFRSAKQISKHANPKNIVFNLEQIKISLDKFKQKIIDDFGSKFNKILIVDRFGKITKLK